MQPYSRPMKMHDVAFCCRKRGSWGGKLLIVCKISERRDPEHCKWKLDVPTWPSKKTLLLVLLASAFTSIFLPTHFHRFFAIQTLACSKCCDREQSSRATYLPWERERKLCFLLFLMIPLLPSAKNCWQHPSRVDAVWIWCVGWSWSAKELATAWIAIGIHM